jgi:hypothetical protein
MSGARRAYNIVRGYVMREWERIQGVERDLAESELLKSSWDEAANEPSRSAMEPAYERSRNPKEVARRFLGVAEDADFATIRQAFDKLNKRSDPKNFPNGSREQEQAAEIQKRVHWAYATLTEDLDPTQKRFRSLELD